MPSEKQLQREILGAGKMLCQRDFVAGCDGNISARLDKDRILITPTGVSKGSMRASDLVVVDLNGRKLRGRRQATSEIDMHLFIYRERPDVHAVVHAHPPTATGFAAAGIALDRPLVCEAVLGLGQIPLAPYGTPGTPELAATLKPYVAHSSAILLANHGAVTYGSDLRSAYMKMEKVEHFARIALVVHMLGQQQPLSPEDVSKLINSRGKCAEPGALLQYQALHVPVGTQ